MEHEEIDKYNLIDRYLMGKLPAEESAGFEEHFVDCPQCIGNLQATKNFMQDLRLVAAEQASQIDRHRPKRAFAHLLQMVFRKPQAWATGFLLIAVAAAAFFVVNHARRLQAEVNQAESLSRQWEQRYENERQSAISAEKKHQETELQRAEQLRALEAKLKDEEARRTKMAAGFVGRVRSGGDVSMFVLTSVRDGGPNTAKANNQFTVPDSSAIVAFSIPLEVETQFEKYHITIFDNRRRSIWKNPRSTPDPDSNSLLIGFKRGFFRPGDYSLTVEGLKKEGGKDTIGEYAFSIIEAP